MKVNVRLFGHFSDLAPEVSEISLASGATVSDLALVLAARDTRLEGMVALCRAAVNEEYASMDTRLNEGDEVAFIPPMSGG